MKNTNAKLIYLKKANERQMDYGLGMNEDLVIKNNSLLLNMFLYISFTFFITLVLVYTAFLERGYFSVGGEYLFLLLLPLGVNTILKIEQKQRLEKFLQ